MKFAKFALAAGVCMGLVAWSTSGADDTPPSGTDVAKAAGVVTPAENDARILAWLKTDCDSITKCAEDAVSRASSDDVKQYAQRVVDEHKKWHQTFKDFKKNDNRTSAYVPPADKTARVVQDDGASRDGRVAYSPTDFLDVKRKVCSHMEKVGEKAMKDLKGAEFDRAFIKHMEFGHEAAIASIDAVRGNASKELAENLDKAKEAMQSHLDKAKELCKAHKQTGSSGN